jgi:hypothetical protein
MAYGTLVTLETLAASDQSIAEIGEDKAYDAVDAALQAHNAIMNEMIDGLAETTIDRQRRYGDDNMSMDEVDEFGRGDAQKIHAGITVGFPLRMFDLSVQWSRKYLQNATGREFAAQVTGAQKAHRKRVIREIKRVIFTPTNTNNWVDRLVDTVQLNLKAFVNADSAAIPSGPNGEAFDGTTHTHYLARAGGSLADTDVVALIETVREHYNTGDQYIYINRAQETAMRGFTSHFTPYLDARLIGKDTADQARGTLSRNNLYNRAIGVFDGAEVWVKPWIPANYIWSWISGVPKPLVKRERRAGAGNLVVAAEDEKYPLRARTLEAEFGFGVWNRTNGAVLYTNNTTYTAPTITD